MAWNFEPLPYDEILGIYHFGIVHYFWSKYRNFSFQITLTNMCIP